MMAGAVRPVTSLNESVERLAAMSFDALQSDPDWTPLSMEFWVHAAREAYARDIVAASLRECRGVVGGLLSIGQDGGVVRDDLDVEAAATLLIGLLDGVALQWIVDRDAVDIDRLRKPTVELIRRFVEGEGAADVDQSDIDAMRSAAVELLERQTSPESESERE